MLPGETRRLVVQRPQPVLLDHVGALLADHDGRCVCVAAHDGRHDGRVDDAQIADAVDAQARIDDGGRVGGRAHLAGAHRMVDGHGQVTDGTLPVQIVVEAVLPAAGYRDPVQTGIELAERLRFADLQANTEYEYSVSFFGWGLEMERGRSVVYEMRSKSTYKTYVQSNFHSLDQRLDVSAFLEVVGVNEWVVERILGA